MTRQCSVCASETTKDIAEERLVTKRKCKEDRTYSASVYFV